MIVLWNNKNKLEDRGFYSIKEDFDTIIKKSNLME